MLTARLSESCSFWISCGVLAGCAASTGVASLVVVVYVEVNPAPPPATEVVSVVDVVSTIANVVKVFLACNFVISSTLV